MYALLIPAALALILALALGGSVRAWARPQVRWPLLATAPFLVLFAMYNPPLDTQDWLIAWGPRIWEGAQLTIIAVLVRNGLARAGLQRAPWAIAAVGAALNALVVMANDGYMPVTPAAPAWVLDKATTPKGAERLHNIVLMTPETHLNWLGDVFVQPSWTPPRPNAVSVGDLLLSGGIAWWVFGTTRATRKHSVFPATLGAPV
jgi:Family of unknown function (DUF5317)